MPAIRAARWPDDLVLLREAAGAEIVATAIQSSVPLDEVARAHLSRPPRAVAIVVGHESKGVSAETRAVADRIVRIPMAEGVDSLNVAVSAAIALDRLSLGVRR